MGIDYGSNGDVLRKIRDMSRPPLTIADMTAECKAINIEKGWRAPDGGPCPGQTFGDYIALAHSELSEALEAYRDHRLADATNYESAYSDPNGGEAKPEGVGSELADTLIRLVDMADVFGIDLEAEYRRKIAFNRTRAFQHGGRTLADVEPAPLNLGSRRQVTAEEVGEPAEFIQHARDLVERAMPTDPRGWWTGQDVDYMIASWDELELPALTKQYASGEVLTLWCTDVERAGDALVTGTRNYGETRGLEIIKGAYTLCVLQASKDEETRRHA